MLDQFVFENKLWIELFFSSLAIIGAGGGGYYEAPCTCRYVQKILRCQSIKLNESQAPKNPLVLYDFLSKLIQFYIFSSIPSFLSSAWTTFSCYGLLFSCDELTIETILKQVNRGDMRKSLWCGSFSRQQALSSTLSKKFIKEICLKSTWHGRFLKLPAFRVTFSKDCF